MINLIKLSLSIIVILILQSQVIVNYSYDAIGNRIKREIVLSRSMENNFKPLTETLSEKSISIYPNPTDGLLKISISGWETTDKCKFTGYAHILNKYTDSVKSVDYLFGATIIKSNMLGDGSGVTLGSYITGGMNIEADPNNRLFQHEYGHYLQSQEMGWAYIAKVGIPSLISAIIHQNGEHKYQDFERDANFRAFKYFNKNVEGFYESPSNYMPNDGKGWNFKKNPLVSKSNNDYSNNYIDYRNKDVMAQVEKSLSIKAMFYHYISIIPGFLEKLKGNY